MTNSTIKQIATVFPVDAEALKPYPQFHRRRSIIHEFSINASAHGIPGIGRSTSIQNRIYWIVSFIVFTGIMIYFVVQSIQSYFSYPTQTLVSFLAQRSQPFPAVSVCNYSPVRFDAFIGPFINYTNALNLTNTNDTSTITPYQAQFIQQFFLNLLNNNESVETYFFPLQSMLMYCTYNGISCTSNDFISFLSATYGLCYTFNAKRTSNQIYLRNTTDDGGTGTLQLRFYAHSEQYVPYVSDDVSVGMVVLVHDNTQLPLIENVGIELIPGRRHKLTYKKTIYQSLSSPYSDCNDEVSPVMQAMFDQYKGADYAYSPILCMLICVAQYIYQECSCASPYQWTSRNLVLPGTDKIIQATLCNITDPCYMNASSRIANSDSIWGQFCSDCSDSCSEVDFTMTPSAVSAPSATEIPVTKAFVENCGLPLPKNWSQTWLSDIQNNYVAVDIVCELTRVESYSESALIGSVDLLSNIGGLTGLWIGASFLTVMEVVEMLYRLIRYHYYMLKRRIENENVIDIKL